MKEEEQIDMTIDYLAQRIFNVYNEFKILFNLPAQIDCDSRPKEFDFIKRIIQQVNKGSSITAQSCYNNIKTQDEPEFNTLDKSIFMLIDITILITNRFRSYLKEEFNL